MKEFVVGSPFTTETTLGPQDEWLIVACDGVRLRPLPVFFGVAWRAGVAVVRRETRDALRGERYPERAR